jgi:hypothetical protein
MRVGYASGSVTYGDLRSKNVQVILRNAQTLYRKVGGIVLVAIASIQVKELV